MTFIELHSDRDMECQSHYLVTITLQGYEWQIRTVKNITKTSHFNLIKVSDMCPIF